MTQRPAAPFHQGMTPERIVDAALDLTRESHLYGWSIRDLARRIDVTPSVIYHHVGGKDLLARRVTERVLAQLPLPAEDLVWQAWFRELVRAVYPLLTAYPGVAKWLLMHGVPFPSLAPTFDVGVGKLQVAGFGDDALFAYSTLMNNATLTISMGDDRLLHEDDGPRDHAAMMAEYRALAVESPGFASLGTDFIEPFASGGEAAARMRERYFRYVVEATIAGVEAIRSR